MFCVCVCVRVTVLSQFRLFVTPWTVDPQAPLSMDFSRPEYWSALSCPPPGYLPNLGTKRESLVSPELADRFFTNCATWEALSYMLFYYYCLFLFLYSS